ncbi:hypothetical protein [Skermanella pratensis]|uniref:hypothetical protein n=1 Tax=Skermanella pratensis TaxID=2233999 RepID=UPI001301796F|nr:hypothetical protein [Skermanella pratensis]
MDVPGVQRKPQFAMLERGFHAVDLRRLDAEGRRDGPPSRGRGSNFTDDRIGPRRGQAEIPGILKSQVDGAGTLFSMVGKRAGVMGMSVDFSAPQGGIDQCTGLLSVASYIMENI